MIYSGICITGPLSGKPLTKKFYRHSAQLENGKFFNYRHLPTTHSPRDTAAGVWIPEDWSTIDALQFLSQHFAETAGGTHNSNS